MFENAVGREDENKNVVPSRKKSRHKIDGVMAGIMSLGRAIEENYDDGEVAIAWA